MFDKVDCDSKKIPLKTNLVLLTVDFEEGTSGLDLSNYSDLIIRSGWEFAIYAVKHLPRAWNVNFEWHHW